MRRAIKFLLLLLTGLAALAFAGHQVLEQTTNGWFDRDLQLRSQLAVSAASRSLVRNWQESARLTAVLEDLTSDERILGAAACNLEGEVQAATAAYPRELGIRDLIQANGGPLSGPEPAKATWSTTTALGSGRVHISGSTIDGEAGPLGFVVLVHDLTFVARREATTRSLMLWGFFVLAIGASVVTLAAARIAWRGWVRELRKALTDDATTADTSTGDFQPLVRDVRSLAERLARERHDDAGTGPWSANRLRKTLLQHLQGERVVILANREPYIHERTDQGIRVLHPASGLVTALEPVMKACSGTWVAHGAGSADRETVDAHDRLRVPPGEESYLVRRVWLTEAEEAGYYYGFANEGLWPLCHLAHQRPSFRAEDWQQYVRVNQRFADAVCEEVDSDDPIILVQDYHFALAPRMIRARLPRATILTFWHIPWPSAERLGICPWREEIIAGLLGSSILGFHTRQHCNHFIDSVDAYVESRIDREQQAVVQGAHRTLIRPYPISIEWPVHWLARVPPVAECRAAIRRQLGLAPDALLGVGIDRLDYTKGIEERLAAVDRLLADRPEFRGRFTFVQLAAPSRTKIPRYRELNEQVEAQAVAINQRWGTESWRPIALLRSHHEPLSVFAHYRAADLCYVSSLHDGMNLVAKEFVAARDDEQGVLVLSQFTGAARDLTEALIVNPYDLQQASAALAAALRMPVDEQKERMRSMRRIVAEFNVYRWAGRMLIDATDLRRRERMHGRLSGPVLGETA
ncbi:MAG: trehalose-6-phosphate synthase [Planctomycetes bacterium]|nr:trehalose-6-phosphate synthase [Planctomycetota bacterium]